jgi:hypothetical protein
MPTVAVDLDVETYDWLTKQAADRGTSVGDLVARLARAEAALFDVDPDIGAVTAEVIERYRPVLRRLGE